MIYILFPHWTWGGIGTFLLKIHIAPSTSGFIVCFDIKLLFSLQTLLSDLMVIFIESPDEDAGSVSCLQKDADRAVVVAVTSRAVFESGAEGDEVYKEGTAFPLLQVRVQCVCEKLLFYIHYLILETSNKFEVDEF